MSLHVITHYVKIEFSIRKFPKESGKFFTARFQISRFHEKISATADKISSLLRTPRRVHGKSPTLPGNYNSPVYRPCTGGQDNPATAILISCSI